jgi:hypothetical protein
LLRIGYIVKPKTRLKEKALGIAFPLLKNGKCFKGKDPEGNLCFFAPILNTHNHPVHRP